MKGYVIFSEEIQNDLSCVFMSNPKLYFEVEKLFVNVVIDILTELNLRNMYVKELYHYPKMKEVVIENEKVDISELKDYYSKYFRECTKMCKEHYSKQMIELFYRIENNMYLNLEQIKAALKLKLRNHICYFKLYSKSDLVIDFGSDCLFVKSSSINAKIVDKIQLAGLNILPLKGTGDGLYV